MAYLKTKSGIILHAVAAMLLFASLGAAQIPGLCDTGQTAATSSGCTGVVVPINPIHGGPNRDGNWALAYPYPTPMTSLKTPCELTSFVPAWVDSLAGGWLPNSATSEWIEPYDGEDDRPAGWYIYATRFAVPAVLPDGSVPTGLIVNGQLASDNATALIYLESPARSTNCNLVSGQTFPVNPNGSSLDYSQWWPFSFTNKGAITPGAEAYLFFAVQNSYDSSQPNGGSQQGLRVEFFATSTFTH
jgi:hypothetical protein